MKNMNHHGFTLVEAIASFVVVSIVLTTAAILIVNAYNQSVATSRQIDAVQVGSRIRDDIAADATYAAVAAWMDGAAATLTADSCDDPGSPFSCGLFAYEADGVVYDAEVAVSFAAPTAESLQYKVIRFTVVVTYYGERTISIEGMIYDV